jgi:predicted nucleic acid-binding protein
MVLVDTSVWINHFRKSDSILVDLLRDNQVCIHPMIVGELACGSLRQRDEILPLLQMLPMTIKPSHDEVLHFIEKRRFFGQGAGWVDMNLLASCVLSKSTLWTKDKSLLKLAQSLELTIPGRL